jgi:hypothetical protein
MYRLINNKERLPFCQLILGITTGLADLFPELLLTAAPFLRYTDLSCAKDRRNDERKLP